MAKQVDLFVAMLHPDNIVLSLMRHLDSQGKQKVFGDAWAAAKRIFEARGSLPRESVEDSVKRIFQAFSLFGGTFGDEAGGVPRSVLGDIASWMNYHEDFLSTGYQDGWHWCKELLPALADRCWVPRQERVRHDFPAEVVLVAENGDAAVTLTGRVSNVSHAGLGGLLESDGPIESVADLPSLSSPSGLCRGIQVAGQSYSQFKFVLRDPSGPERELGTGEFRWLEPVQNQGTYQGGVCLLPPTQAHRDLFQSLA